MYWWEIHCLLCLLYVNNFSNPSCGKQTKQGYNHFRLDYLNQKYWIVLKEDRVFLCVLCVLKLLIQRYGKPHNCFHPAHHLPASHTHPILHTSSLYQPPTHRGNLPSPQPSTLSPLGLSGPLGRYTSIPQSPSLPLLWCLSMSLYILPPPYMSLYILPPPYMSLFIAVESIY